MPAGGERRYIGLDERIIKTIWKNNSPVLYFCLWYHICSHWPLHTFPRPSCIGKAHLQVVPVIPRLTPMAIASLGPRPRPRPRLWPWPHTTCTWHGQCFHASWAVISFCALFPLFVTDAKTTLSETHSIPEVLRKPPMRCLVRKTNLTIDDILWCHNKEMIHDIDLYRFGCKVYRWIVRQMDIGTSLGGRHN